MERERPKHFFCFWLKFSGSVCASLFFNISSFFFRRLAFHVLHTNVSDVVAFALLLKRVEKMKNSKRKIFFSSDTIVISFFRYSYFGKFFFSSLILLANISPFFPLYFYFFSRTLKRINTFMFTKKKKKNL